MIRGLLRKLLHQLHEIFASFYLNVIQSRVATGQEFLNGCVSEELIECVIGTTLFGSGTEPCTTLLILISDTPYCLFYYPPPSGCIVICMLACH